MTSGKCASPTERLERALCSLAGLSVGDAFGERFFIHPDLAGGMIEARALPAPLWPYTDDTLMALSVVSNLRQFGQIHQDALARDFAARYDSRRGYGPAMHSALARIRQGEPWQAVSGGLFSGEGSYGNGAAMRVAPVGAYFADDFNAVVEQARLSAEVTHANAEAVAGAIAVGLAAAVAWRTREEGRRPSHEGFLDEVLNLVPASEVRERMERAREIRSTGSIDFAVAVLGNGVKVTAQDTVPFALWCAAQALESYENALWMTVSGLGDRDTTCAIAGGVVAMHTGEEGIPQCWLEHRESLPGWYLEDGSPAE